MRVPSRRALALVAGGLAAVAFVALAFIGDGPDDHMPAASARSTTTTETTERPRRQTTTSVPTLTPAETTSTSSRFDFVDEPIGDRDALVVTPSETVRIDLSENTVHRVPHENPDGTASAASIVGAGDGAFVLSGQRLFSVPRSLERPLQRIGDGLLLIRSSTPNRAWVARQKRNGFVLEEVDLDGRVTRSTQTLPVDATPHAVRGDRVVLESPESSISIWNGVTGRVEWSSPDSSNILAAGGNRIVWQRSCGSPLCLLHVTNIDTGADTTLPATLSGAEYYPEAHALSPSGRYLATMAGTPEPGPTPFYVRLVDLDTGLMSEADAFEPGPMLWSPDEKWLFTTGGGGGPGGPLRFGYRVDGLDIRNVQVRVPNDFEPMIVTIL